MARNREFDVLLLNTLDRLSRNQTHIAVLYDEMTHNGIKIECVKEPFEESASGKFLRNAFAFLAEVQREKTLGITEEGKLRRVVNDKKLMPGWKPTYGYRFDDDRQGAKNTFIIYEPEAKTVRLIFKLYTAGCSLRSIARKLKDDGIPTPTGRGEWGNSTIRVIIKNTTYIGQARALKWDTRMDESGKHSLRRRPEDEHIILEVPAIIDDVCFAQAQERIEINRLESARHNPIVEESLLRAGFIKCGYCGLNMRVHRSFKRGIKHIEYDCPRSRVYNPCNGPSIFANIIDPLAWRYVGELVEDFSLVEEAIRIVRGEKSRSPYNLQSIDNSMKIAKGQQEQLLKDLRKKDDEGNFKLRGRTRDLVLDDLSKLEEYMDDLVEERRKVSLGQIELDKMEEDIDKFVAFVTNIKEKINSATYEEKRMAMRMLGLIVFVYKENDPVHKRHEMKIRVPQIVSNRY
jgi:site-specific DNA recombinase